MVGMHVELEGAAGTQFETPGDQRALVVTPGRYGCELRSPVEGHRHTGGEIAPAAVVLRGCAPGSWRVPVDDAGAVIDDGHLTMFGFDFEMSTVLRVCSALLWARSPADQPHGCRMLIDELIEGALDGRPGLGVCHNQRTRRPPNATRPRAEGRYTTCT